MVSRHTPSCVATWRTESSPEGTTRSGTPCFVCFVGMVGPDWWPGTRGSPPLASSGPCTTGAPNSAGSSGSGGMAGDLLSPASGRDDALWDAAVPSGNAPGTDFEAAGRRFDSCQARHFPTDGDRMNGTAVVLLAALIPGIGCATAAGRPLMLAESDGEQRLHRPPPGALSNLTAPFTIKVDPKTA